MVVLEGLAPSLVTAARSSRVPGLPLDVFLYAQKAAELSSARRDHVRDSAADALASLRDHGVQYAVVKGPCMARLYENSDDRHYNDIDLVVDGGAFARVCELLAESGIVAPPENRQVWPWMTAVTAEGVNLHGPAGSDIDVHHRLPPWAFATRVDMKAIVRTAHFDESFQAPFVTDEHSALVAGLHVLNDLWKGKLSLQSWRDLLMVARATSWDRIADVYAQHGASFVFTVLRDELLATFPHLEIDVSTSVLGTGSPAAHRRLRALGWDHSSSFSRQRISWVARLPVGRAALFAVASAVPSLSYIRSVDGTYAKYWKRCLREARSAADGLDRRMTPRVPGTSLDLSG